MRSGERICLMLSNRMRKTNLLDQYTSEFISEELFFDTIYDDASRSYNIFKKLVPFDGKEILDVGCGVGARTIYYAQQPVKKITGTDINKEMLTKAKRLVERKFSQYSERVDFKPCTYDKLLFPDNSFDIIVMDCVFEHLSDPEQVLEECLRVVRPEGFVCIDFQPWWGAHGPHLDNLIPIPWAHVFFSEKTLVNVAADIYDSGNYREAFWDYYDNGGEKKPNKWRETDSLLELNRITIKEFERIINKSDAEIYHYNLLGYESINRKWVRTISQCLNGLLMSRLMREYFTRYIICILQKKAS